jgi:hypothetical protein
MSRLLPLLIVLTCNSSEASSPNGDKNTDGTTTLPLTEAEPPDPDVYPQALLERYCDEATVMPFLVQPTICHSVFDCPML